MKPRRFNLDLPRNERPTNTRYSVVEFTGLEQVEMSPEFLANVTGHSGVRNFWRTLPDTVTDVLRQAVGLAARRGLARAVNETYRTVPVAPLLVPAVRVVGSAERPAGPRRTSLRSQPSSPGLPARRPRRSCCEW